MLKTCEVYDITLDIWANFSSMSKAKCAIAVTSINDKYIYVVGGFDGSDRLDTIEKYDIKENKWSVLSVSLNSSLSNAAATAIDKENILILGGGNDDGFSEYGLLLNTSS